MSVSGYGPLANRTEDGLAKSFERRGVFDGAGHMIDHSDRWLSSLACIVLLGPGLSAQPPSSPPSLQRCRLGDDDGGGGGGRGLCSTQVSRSSGKWAAE